jgi:hypothetical protein
MNSIIDYIQLDEDIQPKPPSSAAKKPAKEEPKIPFYFTNYIGENNSVRRIRSQVMVDSREWEDAGKFIEDHIKHNLTVAMLKELEPHIKVERMQDGFTVYGQTMFVGKLDVIE